MNALDFLPPEAQDLLKALKAEGIKQAWIKNAQANSGVHCPVCNDAHWITIAYPVAGPFMSHPSHFSGQYSTVFHEGGYYTCKHETFPCHACGTRQLIIDRYWEEAGLQLNEREWRLAYYAKTGKELPVLSLEQWLAEIPRMTGLKILTGSYGMGKSGMGKSMVAACIRAGVRAHYFTAEDFLRLCRSTFKQEGLSEEMILTQYLSYRFLVVDEVDPERISDTAYGRAALFGLLNKRYDLRGGLATLLISNKDPETLWEYLASRMEDAERIEVTGENLRGRGEPAFWMDKE